MPFKTHTANSPTVFLAGAAGIILEIALARLSALYMGHGMLAAASTLSFYLLGMSLPSILLVSKRGSFANWLSPLLFTSSLFCLAVKWLWSCQLQISAGEHLWALASSLLIMAGFLSGLVLPISLKHSKTNQKFYAYFNSGGALGGLLAGLYLLPQFGLSNLLLSCAGIFLLSAFLTFSKAKISPSTEINPGQNSNLISLRATCQIQRQTLLISTAVFSCQTIFVETCLVRYFSQLCGSSVTALSLIVSLFIAGLAGGNFLALRFNKDTRSTLIVASFLAALGLMFCTAIIYNFPALYIEVFNNNMLLSAACLSLPFATAQGILWPTTADYLENKDEQNSHKEFRLLYLTSALSAALAPWLLMAAFNLQITWGSGTLEAGLRFSMVISCLLAVFYSYSTEKAQQKQGLLKGAVFKLTLLRASIILSIVCLSPPLDKLVLASGLRFLADEKQGRQEIENQLSAERKYQNLVFFRDGLVSTIALFKIEQINLAILREDGRTEAAVALDQTLPAAGAQSTQALLALVPFQFLNGDTKKTALVIGLGLGTTSNTAAALPGMSSVTTCELEPAVIAAKALLDKQNSVYPGCSQQTVLADAREFLRRRTGETQTFSLIISQPSQPSVSGSVDLFSREFLLLTHARLSNGGVFSQWLEFPGLSETALKAYLATFKSVYPRSFVFQGKGARELIIIGLKTKEEIEQRKKDLAPAFCGPLRPLFARARVSSLKQYLSSFYLISSDKFGSVLNSGCYREPNKLATDDNMLLAGNLDPNAVSGELPQISPGHSQYSCMNVAEILSPMFSPREQAQMAVSAPDPLDIGELLLGGEKSLEAARRLALLYPESLEGQLCLARQNLKGFCQIEENLQEAKLAANCALNLQPQSRQALVLQTLCQFALDQRNEEKQDKNDKSSALIKKLVQSIGRSGILNEVEKLLSGMDFQSQDQAFYAGEQLDRSVSKATIKGNQNLGIKDLGNKSLGNKNLGNKDLGNKNLRNKDLEILIVSFKRALDS